MFHNIPFFWVEKSLKKIGKNFTTFWTLDFDFSLVANFFLKLVFKKLFRHVLSL